MDLAITGSTGFIGAALVADLVAAGHRVLRVVRPSSTGTDGDTLRWDPEAGTIDAAVLEGIDALVHLAGEGIETRKWNPAQKARILESRTAGTKLLARTLEGLSRPPRVWVSGSAVGFYGDRGDDVVDETAEPGDDFLASVCVQWEAASRNDADTRVAHIRTGIVLDPSGGALRAQLPFFRLGVGGRIGDGTQYWSWISLADQIGAIRHLVEHDIAGPVNLTAPTPVTNAEFTAALGKALRRPTLLPTPRLATNLRLGRELADALLYTSTRAVPQVLLDEGYRFEDPELGPALARML
ncbi:MAG: TIGR01777 family oxidoreductase [Acidimicrobiia bacterium]|nr:TIGR01777 family oxidoreductase [Acidimicrobiia bacterium]